MRLCIYCGKEALRQQGDHCLPTALGDFPNPPRLMQICKHCDSDIGRVEQRELLGDSPEAMTRFQVNPQTGSLRRRTTSRRSGAMLAELDGIEVPAAHLGGSNVEGLDFLIFRDSRGNDVRVNLYPGMTADSIRRALAKRGLGEQAPVEYWLSDEMHAIVRGLWPSARLIDVQETRPGTMRVPITTRHALTKDYWRALAKIAFHHLLCSDPHLQGADEVFEPVRRFIRYGSGPVPFARIPVTHWPGFAVIGSTTFRVPDNLCHVVGVGTVGAELVGYVRLFVHGSNPNLAEHLVRLACNAPWHVPIRCLAYCYKDDLRSPSHIEQLHPVHIVRECS